LLGKTDGLSFYYILYMIREKKRNGLENSGSEAEKNPAA
jgi:hypothetical protein